MQPTSNNRIPAGLIFSDLDGTLLDHHTYDFTPARKALDSLKSRGVHLILCSSKTRAELLLWQQRLSITGPFISENGGGVFLTGDGPLAECFPRMLSSLPAMAFGTSYAILRKKLKEAAGWLGLKARGFGEMTLEEVVSLTGLPIEEARLALQRDFDEPLVFEGGLSLAQKDALRGELKKTAFKLVEGGRLWHLTGGNDKGLAVRWLLAAYEKCFGAIPPVLALGDSENDFPMLLSVKKGVLVEKPGGEYARGAPPGVQRVKGVGPLGWALAVNEWLDTELSKPK